MPCDSPPVIDGVIEGCHGSFRRWREVNLATGTRSAGFRGGRAGPHNQHHDNGLPHLFHSDRFVYIAHFNAGLRLYDTSDPYHVREVGYFMPPDPERRLGVFPTRLVAQTEDVIVDARGYAYLSDKIQGLHVVRARLP